MMVMNVKNNECNINQKLKNKQNIKDEDNALQKTEYETKSKEAQQNLEIKEIISPEEKILNFEIEINKDNIDKLKKELSPLLKKKRGRTKTGNNESEHNKFSDDNLRRKCKHIVLENTMNFINDKIVDFYGNIGKGMFIKKLLIINQSQITNATILFNKIFLNKTLGEIFSDKIINWR